MSTRNRKQLLEASQHEGQRTGNLNVLLTNAIAQQIGLSATEFECFSLLLDKGPMPAGKLACYCGITTGGLTGLVDRLEKLGYVKRTTDPQDRRRVLVEACMNDEVQSRLFRLYGPMMRGFGKITDQYSDDELAFMVSHYEQVNAVMESAIAELAMKNKGECKWDATDVASQAGVCE